MRWIQQLFAAWHTKLVAGLAAVVVAGMGPACESPPPEPKAAAQKGTIWENSPQVCAIDEVREYACEELVPLRSALPAPPPYESCPGQIEGHYGELDPKPTVAGFDASYTEYFRQRTPPGHACCYSWCARLTLADASQVDPSARCSQPMAMRETYCFDEPESGTSDPSAAPYERCPQAMAPPAKTVFYAPPGALLDTVLTTERRRVGQNQCCYAWCSIVPQTTGPLRR